MLIKKFEFENFRSFQPREGSIDLEKDITFFVGKNHTGKSNLIKLLTELKTNHLPTNQQYVLKKDNWRNSEIGVDRPLKIKITVNFNEDDYQFLCEKWFLEPIKVITKLKIEESQIHEGVETDFSYSRWRSILKSFLPESECILRMEFIRYSDIAQEMNYSLQFNDFIVVKTADGRQFIQNLRKNEKLPYDREEILWDFFLWKQISEAGLEKIPEFNLEDIFFQLLSTSRKYIFSSESIDEFYNSFFQQLIFMRGSQIVPTDLNSTSSASLNLNLNQFMAQKISHLRNKASNELEALGISTDIFQTQNKSDLVFQSPSWRKYNILQKRFASLYEGLDIYFDIKNENNILTLEYLQRNSEKVFLNFDSVGTGITEMLYFLYLLVVDENHLFLLENPEYNMHPHSQRTLYNLVKEYCPHNQIVIITHSLFLFQPDDLFNLRIFTLNHGITQVNKLQLPRNPHDYYRLKRNFSINNRDAIFADGLIFCEGPSEEWTFGYFFRLFGLDLDLNNLSLINIGGKGSFEVFLKFAQQLQKKFWFFFDNDILGHKAGENITPAIFQRSLIYKKRNLIHDPAIHKLCNELVSVEDEDTIDFEEKLELLRNLLYGHHIFIFPTDFEGIFEEYLEGKVSFKGGKVEKAIQLLDYLKEHEDEQILPDRLYQYIEIIQEELKSP